MVLDPADQPDVELVVTVDTGVPTVVGRQAADGKQSLVAAAEHIGSGLVDGVQQIGDAQAGRAGAGGSSEPGHGKGRNHESSRRRWTDVGAAVRPYNSP